MDELMPQAVSYILAVICGGLGVLMVFWRPGPNLWIGVRLPWTYADRQIWDKSYQLAAVLLVVMGIGGYFSWVLFFITAALLIVLGILYPIRLYRRKYGSLRFWKDQGWQDYHPVVRCSHCGHYQNLREAAELQTAVCEGCGRLCRN